MSDPTDELRAAANLLRARAAAVPTGKWVPDRTRGTGSPVVVNDRSRPSVLIETHAARYEDVNAYLLLWSPEIAEPLACLLEEAALRRDRGEGFQAHAENLAGLLVDSEQRTKRVFTEHQEPPFGERISLTTPTGERLTWTGKRWHWGDTADVQLHDAWPPEVPGPYIETALARP